MVPWTFGKTFLAGETNLQLEGMCSGISGEKLIYFHKTTANYVQKHVFHRLSNTTVHNWVHAMISTSSSIWSHYYVNDTGVFNS